MSPSVRPSDVSSLSPHETVVGTGDGREEAGREEADAQTSPSPSRSAEGARSTDVDRSSTLGGWRLTTPVSRETTTLRRRVVESPEPRASGSINPPRAQVE